MDKSLLSERDICTKFISPAIVKAAWDITSQIQEEVSFTDGKIYIRGSLAMRGKRKRADDILYYRANIPLAIIEARDNNHSMGAGMQQALEYARILFLADRTALVDQTQCGDFRHFKDKITVIKKHQVDKSDEIYPALYQGFTGSKPEQDIFKQFSREFFVLDVVDECHHGSAREDSAWRRILEHYSSVTHIGLTATPKETELISSIEYFGETINTSSLRQGINVAKGAMTVYQGDTPVKATIHCSSYKVDHDVIDLEYFKRFLKSTVFVRLLKEQVPGGIKTEIKLKHLLPLTIGLHELPVQQSILSQFLNTEGEYTQLTSEIVLQEQLLTSYRRAALKDAIKWKLTADWREEHPNVGPPSELFKRIEGEKAKLFKAKKIRKQIALLPINEGDIPFDIPETWEWCRMGDLLYENPRNGHSAKPADRITKTVTLKLGTITSGRFLESEIKYLGETMPKNSNLWLTLGDILIQHSNSMEYVGGSAFFTGCSHPVIYPDLMMKLRTSRLLCNEYINAAVSARKTREYFRDNAKGAKKSMPKINQGLVSNALIPLPPKEEQNAIMKRVQAKFSVCDRSDAEIAACERQAEHLSAAILQEVFDD